MTNWKTELWREIFGRHSTLWNYSKEETLKKTIDFIDNLLQEQREEIIEEVWEQYLDTSEKGFHYWLKSELKQPPISVGDKDD